MSLYFSDQMRLPVSRFIGLLFIVPFRVRFITIVWIAYFNVFPADNFSFKQAKTAFRTQTKIIPSSNWGKKNHTHTPH